MNQKTLVAIASAAVVAASVVDYLFVPDVRADLGVDASLAFGPFVLALPVLFISLLMLLASWRPPVAGDGR